MNNNLQTITAKLWDMANELRGNMDASEYKNYILAFMFYRYLSERQEAYLLDGDVLDLMAGQSLNDAYKAQASGDDLDDYLQDISATLGYAINPENTWAYIRHSINSKKSPQILIKR